MADDTVGGQRTDDRDALGSPSVERQERVVVLEQDDGLGGRLSDESTALSILSAGRFLSTLLAGASSFEELDHSLDRGVQSGFGNLTGFDRGDEFGSSSRRERHFQVQTGLQRFQTVADE